MIIELSWTKLKNKLIDKYYHLTWWIKNKKYKRIPCLLLGHKWEFWNLLNSYKCKRCGDPRSWHEGEQKPFWGRGYYEDRQYMKKDAEHQDAIRHRKSMPDGKVGYFNSNGDRLA